MASSSDPYVVVTDDVTEERYFEGDDDHKRPSKFQVFVKGQVASAGEVKAAEARGVKVPTTSVPTDDPNVRPGAILDLDNGKAKDKSEDDDEAPAAAGEAHKRPAARRSS